jgi:hypothetical protein
MIPIEARSDPKIGKARYPAKQNRATIQNSRRLQLSSKEAKTEV